MEPKKITFAAITVWPDYGKYRFFLHLLVWLIYIFLYAYIYALFYANVSLYDSLLQYSLTAWIDVAATYFTVYLLIPKLLLQKRYWPFLFLLLVTAIVFIFMQRIVVYFITYPVIYPDFHVKQPFFGFNYLFSFFNIYVMPAIFASVKFFEFWYVNQIENRELQKQKLESELKFLKSQIHPHFLFNTLNNLYALTLDKSEQAPEVIVKLSGLLSYMLYDCNAPRVPLEKEIDLLIDYLALEKIRYPNELKVNFDVRGRVAGKMIAPLLLLPFVENGFKHGLSKQIKNPWIDILVDIEGYLLIFSVENIKSVDGSVDETNYTEGIGLKNVRRRLELIYADKFLLKVKNTENAFSIILQLQLDSENHIRQGIN